MYCIAESENICYLFGINHQFNFNVCVSKIISNIEAIMEITIKILTKKLTQTMTLWTLLIKTFEVKKNKTKKSDS